MRLESDRRYRFSADPDQVWDALRCVDHYRSWWPWLDEFDTTHAATTGTPVTGTAVTGTATAGALAPGMVWRCSVRSPIQIVLRFTITLEVVTDPSHIGATVTGDLVGPASLRILPRPAGGSEIRLTSALAPRSTTLGLLMGVAPPLAKWAHDRLLDTAARQFELAVAAGIADRGR
jgi:hypothetical protein